MLLQWHLEVGTLLSTLPEVSKSNGLLLLDVQGERQLFMPDTYQV